ncbi:MAG: histidine phosphatase family protein [Candidatus Paceibacterota bacterium]
MERFENKLERRENGFEKMPEVFRTKVVLDFFRHDEKDPNKVEPIKPDEEVELTPKGKLDAKGHAKIEDTTFAIATGTDRKRARQTAIYHMAGKNEAVTGEETYEELEQVVNKGREYGSKIVTDNRLNFTVEKNTPFGKVAFERFFKGEYLKFLVEESDQFSKEVGNTEESTYSSLAGNVAELVKKNIAVSRNFDQLYQSKSEEERKTNELQRFFGSHQGVTESFLAKLIENIKGVEERDKFVKILKNRGFDFSEGFEIDILNKDTEEEPKIKISYRKEVEGEEPFIFEEEIPSELIDQIILEGK